LIHFSPGFTFNRNNKHHFAVLVIPGFSFKSKWPKLCALSTLEYILDNTRDCNSIRNLYEAIPAEDGEDVYSWELSIDKFFSDKTVCGKQFGADLGRNGTWTITAEKRVAQAMAEILVRNSNGTFSVYYNSQKMHEKQCFYGTIAVDKEYQQVMVDSTRTNFHFVKLFTCYEEPKLSFYLYISPFDTPIWILTFCGGISVFLFVSVFQKVSNLASVDSSFSYLLFVVGALIEEAYILPAKLQRFLTFKILFFPWVITSMLLSTGYNSILVAKLNSPLQTQSIDSINQVFCTYTKNYDKKSATKETAKFLVQVWQKFPVRVR